MGRWRAVRQSDPLPPTHTRRQGNHYYEYKCCPDGESEVSSGESEEMCGDFSNITWTPGVCYWLTNITLNEGTFAPLSEPVHACKEISPTVTGLLIGMFLLAIIRILLQLVWYMRWNAKRDQGMMICCSNREAFIARVHLVWLTSRLCISCRQERRVSIFG